MLLNYNPLDCLPSAEDLPDSDDTPVDNELQDLVPHLLKAILSLIWSERMDWYFGVDMGIYYDPNQPAIVPDGFLSLGVPRIIDSDLRLSYVLWEELKLPTLAIEIVSHKRRGEYTQKKAFYEEMGIPLYVIYNPLRKRKARLEVHRLVNGKYQLLPGEPVWLEELQLGIGREYGSYLGIEREWLYWYDEAGNRYLSPEERIIEERQEGMKRGKQELIFHMIEGKFGQIPVDLQQKIQQLDSILLDDLAISLLSFSAVNQLESWLNRKPD
jgi:Uma2 family endonuclease